MDFPTMPPLSITQTQLTELRSWAGMFLQGKIVGEESDEQVRSALNAFFGFMAAALENREENTTSSTKNSTGLHGD